MDYPFVDAISSIDCRAESGVSRASLDLLIDAVGLGIA